MIPANVEKPVILFLLKFEEKKKLWNCGKKTKAFKRKSSSSLLKWQGEPYHTVFTYLYIFLGPKQDKKYNKMHSAIK